MANKRAENSFFLRIYDDKIFILRVKAGWDFLLVQVTTLVTCKNGSRFLASTEGLTILSTGCHENVLFFFPSPTVPREFSLILCSLFKQQQQQLRVELNL